MLQMGKNHLRPCEISTQIIWQRHNETLFLSLKETIGPGKDWRCKNTAWLHKQKTNQSGNKTIENSLFPEVEIMGHRAETPSWERKNWIVVEKRIRIRSEIKYSWWKNYKSIGRNWTAKSQGKATRRPNKTIKAWNHRLQRANLPHRPPPSRPMSQHLLRLPLRRSCRQARQNLQPRPVHPTEQCLYESHSRIHSKSAYFGRTGKSAAQIIKPP